MRQHLHHTVQSDPSVYIGPMQQQQSRQTVCWSNASLPDAKGGGGNDPKNCGDDNDVAAKSNDAPSLHGLGVASAKLRQSLRSSKRRLIQQILVKINHAEASDDSEYLALRNRQLDLHERIAALATHVKSFATNLVALGHGSSLIGDASVQIAASMAQSMMLMGNDNGGCGGGAVSRGSLFATASCNEAVSSNNNSSSAIMGIGGGRRASDFSGASFDSDFPKNMVKLDTYARGLAGIVLTTVVGSLEKKLAAMTALKREMDEREDFKLDFDSALRKLRAAKQRGKAEAIVRRDVKLQAARNTLALATETIIKKFLYYESARPVLIYHELRQFRELQTRFFTLCTSSFQMHEQLDLQEDDSDNNGGVRSQATLSNPFVG